MAYRSLNDDSNISIPLSSAKGHDYDSYARTERISKSNSWGRRKWILVGVGILLVVVGGIAAGVAANKHTSKSSSNTVSSGSSNGKVSGDPSNFTKDPALHLSFPGIAYSSINSANYPACGDTIEQVIQDVQLLSQLTTTLRLYGADCNQSTLVLDAISQTKVNLKVYLGLYFELADSSVFDRQLQETIDALQMYGVDNVLGVTVGNEIILQAAQGNLYTTTQARNQILANVQTTKKALAKIAPNVKVGNGEAGSEVTTALAEGVDYIMSNNQAFFSGNTIQDSANWTLTYSETDTPSSALKASNKPTLFIGEVGWPTFSFPNGTKAMNGSEASIANTQIFLNDWVCTDNAAGQPWFWFQAFDADWTIPVYGGVESSWGLWRSDRTLKDLTIPNCSPQISNVIS